MEFRSLRYFVAIVDCGSLTRASRSLFIAQPALSHHLAALEEELGVSLLHRSPRGVKPTQAGKTLYRNATAVLRQVSLIPAQIKQQESTVSGRVSVGIPTSTAEVLAMPLLQAIFAKFPSISLEIESNSSRYLLEWLVNGRLDFSLLFLTEPVNPIVITPLLSEELCLISSRKLYKNKSNSGSNVPLDNIQKLPLVLPPPENGLRRVVDLAFRNIGSAPNIVAELSSLQMLKLAVNQGVAATILPISALPNDWHGESLFTGRIIKPIIARTVSLCTNTDIPLSEAAQKVCTELVLLLDKMCEENSWPGYVNPMQEQVLDL
jgi:LysR family nitrogen assimilation transcriptional regulator